MPRVFISHSSQDHQRVEREIITPLRAHGVETWYSTDNIKSASEWERQIRAGLKDSDWFLIVLSPRSVASEWVEREVHWAFLKRKERIVPVMLETCEPDDLHLGLLPLQFIDFRNDPAAAQERLLAVWGMDKASQVESRHQAAREALGREDWGAAVEHLEALLRLDPARPQAQEELTRARRRQEFASLYEAGLDHLRKNRWREALAALRRVREEDADYRDVADSIARAEAALQKEEAERLYREGIAAAGREEWAAAAEQLEAALRLDPSHAEARGALGRAVGQKALAELYAAGCEHLQARRWRDALKSFRQVRELDKGYGGVADLIAEAYAGLEDEEERRPERERQEREAREGAERREREQAQQAGDRLYREALDALGREEWDTARERLRAAAAADPGNGEITARLVEVDGRQRAAALFDDGLQHLSDRRWAEALDTFRQVQEAGGGYRDVSAQIARAQAGLKKLWEQREREQQRKEREKEWQEQEQKQEQQEKELPKQERQKQQPEPQEQQDKEADEQQRQEGEPRRQEDEPRRQAGVESPNKNFEFQAWRGVGATPDEDAPRRELGKPIAIAAGATLLTLLLAFLLWPTANSPKAPAPKQPVTAADFYNRAEDSLKRSKNVEAEADYRKAALLAPNNPDYQDGIGSALYYQGLYEKAEEFHRKAISMNANKAAYYLHLGHDLYSQNIYPTAADAYRRATELDRSKAEYHRWHAAALSSQGKYKEATAAYRQTVSLDPNDYVAYLFLSDVLRRQNMNAEADAMQRKSNEIQEKLQAK